MYYYDKMHQSRRESEGGSSKVQVLTGMVRQIESLYEHHEEEPPDKIPLPSVPKDNDEEGDLRFCDMPFDASYICDPITYRTSPLRMDRQLSRWTKESVSDRRHAMSEALEACVGLSHSHAPPQSDDTESIDSNVPPGLSPTSKRTKWLRQAEIDRHRSIAIETSAIVGGLDEIVREKAAKSTVVLHPRSSPPRKTRVLRLKQGAERRISPPPLTIPNYASETEPTAPPTTPNVDHRSTRPSSEHRTHVAIQDLASEFDLCPIDVDRLLERRNAVRKPASSSSSLRAETKWQALQRFVRRAAGGRVSPQRTEEMMRLLKEIDRVFVRRKRRAEARAMREVRHAPVTKNESDDHDTGTDALGRIMHLAVEGYEEGELSLEQLNMLVEAYGKTRDVTVPDVKLPTLGTTRRQFTEAVQRCASADVAEGKLSEAGARRLLTKAQRIEKIFAEADLDVDDANTRHLASHGKLSTSDVRIIYTAINHRALFDRGTS